jgi:tetratricopeptide (TPR) repeat protein
MSDQTTKHNTTFQGYDPLSLFQAIGSGVLGPCQGADIANQAIASGSSLAWNLPLAFVAYLEHNYSLSLALLQSVESLFSGNTDWCILAGMSSRQIKEQHALAVTYYRRALELSPDRADIYYNYGNLVKDDNPAEAEVLYRHSLALDSRAAQVWHNLGISLNEQNMPDHAIIPLKISLQLDPFIADAWCNLGLAFYGQDSFLLAEQCFRHAISLDVNSAPSHVNLGNVLMSTFQPEEAILCLERGVELDKSSTNSLFNLGLAYLSTGNFKKGWEYYEARFSTKDFSNAQVPTSGPRVKTLHELASLRDENKQVVVWSEQGMGDSIQFCRYLSLLKSLDVPFVFLARSQLYTLHCAWTEFGPHVQLLGSTDVETDDRPHLPLMSLPLLFGTDHNSIPSFTPYFTSSSPTPPYLQINPPPGGLSVGFVWATNPDNKAMYENKSMSADLLMPSFAKLVKLGLINLHSLQFGRDSSQLGPWLCLDGVYQWHECISDFSDTAYLLRQMDLVITVDTAIAHLAGALNRPTWLLLPANCDFRWLRSSSWSPWYPSMRLFRQLQHGDWSSVVDEVRRALDIMFLLDIDALSKDSDRHLFNDD